MSTLGGYLIFMAIGSALLSLTDYQFRLLTWMDDLGAGAWVIRAIAVAVGAGLIMADQNQKKQQQRAMIARRQQQGGM